ncbi:MAG: hypothetical protein Q8Q30_01845 [Candidatus Woesebacteria bacterium]|nr:hypothetical protein [Candidatus Woesebacteria bacterium]
MADVVGYLAKIDINYVLIVSAVLFIIPILFISPLEFMRVKKEELMI